MKKIILITDSQSFTTTAMRFIKKLSGQGKLFILGAFTHSRKYQQLLETASALNSSRIVDLIEEDREAVEQNILLFRRHCLRKQINFRINKEYNSFETHTFVKESRFADAIIINGEMIAEEQAGKENPFLRELLTTSECPLLVLPNAYHPINKVVIAYDGQKQSMFALKQFYYLFPSFTQLPTEVAYVKPEGKAEIPQARKLNEYLLPSFPALNVHQVQMEPKEIDKWASVMENAVFITGSYSRLHLFEGLSPHFADPIVNLKTFPVFIAHR